LDPVVFQDKGSYLEFCGEQYFSACEDNRVLEIGAGHGRHSEKILQRNPAHLTTIEGDKQAATELSSVKGINIVVDDVMMVLKNDHPFDVVICLGVLYHLHSPIHLLELIANHCRPSVIVLDCVMAPDVLQFCAERPNNPGNNQTRNGWRSAGLNLVAPFLVYLQCMDALGYELRKVHRLQVKNYFAKQNSWMALWRIKNDCSQNSST
jgi:SAM-dependent methyltransferase